LTTGSLERRFNYLITVHNKEQLLPAVLRGVEQCASADARVVVVLDGCTDGSRRVAEEFQASTPLTVVLVEAPDVHEIRAINVGLVATQPGYCVVLQDDVVLQEPRLEQLLLDLCEQHGHRLGFISLRLAANVRPTALLDRVKLAIRARKPSCLLPMADHHELVSSPHEHMDEARAPYHAFVPRMVGIKSPVCLTPELRDLAPRLDEAFAPYCYDDYDLSLQALRAGLRNGLFPVHFRSDVEWGGTRQDPSFSSSVGARIRLRNRRLLWKKHSSFLRSFTPTQMTK
jgi:glycosyltransferase involved in cell wall biosynthesis